MKLTFTQLSSKVADAAGSPYAAGAALTLIVGWLIAAFVFGFTDTMQLLINTSTTIITFLMVFVIQASQNHDTKVIHLKLDELLRALESARTELAAAEDLSDDEIKRHIEDIKNS